MSDPFGGRRVITDHSLRKKGALSQERMAPTREGVTSY